MLPSPEEKSFQSLHLTVKQSILWIFHMLFKHLPVNGHLNCFLFLLLSVKRAHTRFVWTYALISLE